MLPRNLSLSSREFHCLPGGRSWTPGASVTVSFGRKRAASLGFDATWAANHLHRTRFPQGDTFNWFIVLKPGTLAWRISTPYPPGVWAGIISYLQMPQDSLETCYWWNGQRAAAWPSPPLLPITAPRHINRTFLLPFTNNHPGAIVFTFRSFLIGVSGHN